MCLCACVCGLRHEKSLRDEQVKQKERLPVMPSSSEGKA